MKFALFAEVARDLTGLERDKDRRLLQLTNSRFLLGPYLGLLSHDPWAPCKLTSLWPFWPLGSCRWVPALPRYQFAAVIAARKMTENPHHAPLSSSRNLAPSGGI